jgi:hypothetical protein
MPTGGRRPAAGMSLAGWRETRVVVPEDVCLMGWLLPVAAVHCRGPVVAHSLAMWRANYVVRHARVAAQLS